MRQPGRGDRGGGEDPGGTPRDHRGAPGHGVPDRLVDPRAVVDRAFREEWGRAVATLIRIVGDIDLAEESVQDAFAVAVSRWPTTGVPDNPGAWITRTARNKAIDRLRRERTLRTKTGAIAELERLRAQAEENRDEEEEEAGVAAIQDDRLRLMFTCCHPALSLEAQVALTLRLLGGLTTREIARGFMMAEPAVAQRLVRAKRKIREARIPFRVPPEPLLGERVDGVLAVLYLIFNEGYLATDAPSLVRDDLCEEAIRLARVLVALLPGDPEALGLLALMLLHHSRRRARVGQGGEVVLLEQQDRSRWDRSAIAEGMAAIDRAATMGRPGPYQVQAEIVALHAQAPSSEATDWPEIAGLYAALAAMTPSPVVELNRAVAVAMADGPAAGLAMVDAVASSGALDGYPWLHSARADLLRRLGRDQESASAYRRALEVVTNPVDRAFLEGRLADLSG